MPRGRAWSDGPSTPRRGSSDARDSATPATRSASARRRSSAAYLKPSVLDSDSLRLLDTPHSLNLITIKRASEPPAHLRHLGAVWPGPIFEFKPEYGQVAAPSADMRSLCACLSLVGGVAPTAIDGATPLGMLNWARVAHRQLTAMPITRFGGVLSNKLDRASSRGATSARRPWR